MENFLLKEMAQCLRRHFTGGQWPASVLAFVGEWKAKQPHQKFLRSAANVEAALVQKMFFGYNVNQRAKETRKDINNGCNPLYPELRNLPSGKQEPAVLHLIRQKMYDLNRKENVKAAMTQCIKRWKGEVCSDGTTPKYLEEQIKEKVSLP